jgi:vanillate O-demethylase ferredoxin subunit
MGMHLARREIILLIEALRRQVARFEGVGPPEVAMNNTIRAFSKLPIRVHLADEVLPDLTAQDVEESPWIDGLITARRDEATDIIGLEIQSADGAPLPPYDAGAHVDVQVRSGLTRQYSLTGDPSDRSRYHLGILRDPNSRGGSRAIHADFQLGNPVRIGRPRNNFPLQDGAAHSILFAGGIGITPMLSMALALEAKGVSWELHYCGRSADRLAYLPMLETFGGKVQIHLDDGDAAQRLDIETVLKGPEKDRHLYICGPNGFMDFVVAAAEQAAWTPRCVHLERFGAEVDTNGAPFTVVAHRSGKTIEVSPGETIADQLNAHGIAVQVSCQSGVCGTCLTPVLDGMPDHRDLVQTETEKAANGQITVCCSRSKTKCLVLDI